MYTTNRNYNRKGFSDNDKFDLLFRITIGFIITVFIAIVFWISFVIYAAATVYDETKVAGIKPIIEKIWCGSPGCMK